MPWYLILVAGFILGWLVKTALDVAGEYWPARPVDPEIAAQFQPATEEPQRHGASAVLGYNDLGGEYIAPTHPVTRGAHNSVTALAAWDRRNRRGVA